MSRVARSRERQNESTKTFLRGRSGSSQQKLRLVVKGKQNPKGKGQVNTGADCGYWGWEMCY